MKYARYFPRSFFGLRTSLYTLILCACWCIVTLFNASPAYANPRYASFVLDVDSGTVLHEENATARRYPASLTKMMTLYLLFEALEQRKFTLNSKFTASAKAASMPQTNLSLRRGDTIRVEDAIKALVVRSANDVAVVVGEALGHSEWNFGTMMTAKAKQLGMHNTVFRNASGLPDRRQYTTAYDMALLGIALRRDFPQYYHYFKVSYFSFKGRNYYGHNNVMGRFNGADGIKTGYINDSGFNLVTSVKRGGRSLVGVVMGGRTGRSRDDHMIALLTRSFAKLQQGGPGIRQVNFRKTPTVRYAQATPAIPSSAVPLARPDNNPDNDPDNDQAQPAIMAKTQPMPKPDPAKKDTPKKTTGNSSDSSTNNFSVTLREQKTTNTPSGRFDVTLSPNAIPVESPQQTPKKQTARNVVDATIALDAAKPAPSAALPPPPPASKQYAPNTLNYQLAKMGNVASVPSNVRLERTSRRTWVIQVGAYAQKSQALHAAARAMQLVEPRWPDVYIAIQSQTRGAEVHRARLGNLSREQSEQACQLLRKQNISCFSMPQY